MDYSKIPEGPDLPTLKEYLRGFLDEKEMLANKHSLLYALNQLSIIAEKYAFFQLDTEIEQELNDYILSIIDFNDRELIDVLLFIIVNMNMKKLMRTLLENSHDIQGDIRKMIIESSDEMAEL